MPGQPVDGAAAAMFHVEPGIAQGTLYLARSREPEGSFEEEGLPFGSLQQLLDLCAEHARQGAFVRVQVVGPGAGGLRRLVLDFGNFGLTAG